MHLYNVLHVKPKIIIDFISRKINRLLKIKLVGSVQNEF